VFAPAYLDHNATTPLDAGVLEAMLPFLKERYGNPSSRHEYGRAARAAIDAARQQVAAAVGAHPTEVVFASGGSEANNPLHQGRGGLPEAGHRGGVGHRAPLRARAGQRPEAPRLERARDRRGCRGPCRGD
jgi:Cysteine sulfinate desulfinase/cysteine desulfurase and related enzymes